MKQYIELLDAYVKEKKQCVEYMDKLALSYDIIKRLVACYPYVVMECTTREELKELTKEIHI